MMIERIKLSSLGDSHFCALRNETRSYRNAKYRSLLVETWTNIKGPQSLNIIQVADAKTLKDLKFRYADDCSLLAVSSIERCLDRLEYGLGDIRPGAHYLILDHAEIGMTAAKLARWLNMNCSGDAITLEGGSLTRVSFDSDDDYLLAKINFS